MVGFLWVALIWCYNVGSYWFGCSGRVVVGVVGVWTTAGGGVGDLDNWFSLIWCCGDFATWVVVGF